MTQVPFSPTGIALKQHELYGLDNDRLLKEAQDLRSNIVAWSIKHFLLDDEQISWLSRQDDSFTVEFALIVATGISNRYDINIVFEGNNIPRPKSKIISAKENLPRRTILISVIKTDK